MLSTYAARLEERGTISSSLVGEMRVSAYVTSCHGRPLHHQIISPGINF